jgi:hypothetical protein
MPKLFACFYSYLLFLSLLCSSNASRSILIAIVIESYEGTKQVRFR